MLAANMELNAILGRWRLDRLIPEVTATNRVCREAYSGGYYLRLGCWAILGERPERGLCFDQVWLEVSLIPIWNPDVYLAAREGYSVFGPGNKAAGFWNFHAALASPGKLPAEVRPVDIGGFVAWDLSRADSHKFRNIIILEPIQEPAYKQKHGLK